METRLNLKKKGMEYLSNTRLMTRKNIFNVLSFSEGDFYPGMIPVFIL